MRARALGRAAGPMRARAHPGGRRRKMCGGAAWPAGHAAGVLGQGWECWRITQDPEMQRRGRGTRACSKLYFQARQAGQVRWRLVRIVVLRLFKLNIKARHEIQKKINANLVSIRLIAFNIDWR